MKTSELTLDLQAYVDGELEAGRRAEVERVLADDAAARVLVEDLRRLGEIVREHEPIHRVQESREFYWSQIQRRIEQEERAEARASGSASRAVHWLRWLVPALGVAAVAVMVTLPRQRVAELASGTPSGEFVSVTFRSDSEGVTVHWVD